MNGDLTIVTPTFNRKHTLPLLYNSLEKQTNNNFVWLVVDDGSTDGTGEYIESIRKEGKIEIIYIYQENGGKGKALNKSFAFCDEKSFLLIVDSDDYLLSNAVEIIQQYKRKYECVEEVGGFFFFYEDKKGKRIKPSGEIIDKDITLNRYEYNKKYKQNDGCICYKAEVVKKYKYPEFDGEKYIGPTVIQMLMAKEYKIVFSPEIIGVAEYHEDGLTFSGRKLRIKNPKGMIVYSGLLQADELNLLTRLKYFVGAQAYCFISKASKDEIVTLDLKKYLKKCFLVPGWILKVYWKYKYSEGNGNDIKK